MTKTEKHVQQEKIRNHLKNCSEIMGLGILQDEYFHKLHQKIEEGSEMGVSEASIQSFAQELEKSLTKLKECVQIVIESPVESNESPETIKIDEKSEENVE